jgi:hypothetical protein
MFTVKVQSDPPWKLWLQNLQKMPHSKQASHPEETEEDEGIWRRVVLQPTTAPNSTEDKAPKPISAPNKASARYLWSVYMLEVMMKTCRRKGRRKERNILEMMMKAHPLTMMWVVEMWFLEKTIYLSEPEQLPWSWWCKYEDNGAMMKALQRIFKSENRVVFHGNYNIPMDPLITDK